MFAADDEAGHRRCPRDPFGASGFAVAARNGDMPAERAGRHDTIG
jgi:hypothetical protein